MVAARGSALRRAAWLLVVPLLTCCRERSSAVTTPPASASVRAAPAGSASPGRARALLSAEHSRTSAAVTTDDLSAREPSVRRAAARALARIADARARELLTRSISDEDPEVVVWSAYGLGFACRDREVRTIRALVARAASLLAGKSKSALARTGASELDAPLAAIADALGRCGGSDAERTLRAWLSADAGGDARLAEAAALALGRTAARTGKLEDASLVALLDAALRRPPVSAALQAFTRLSGLDDSVRLRLLDAARHVLDAPGPQRAFAVRALAAAGEPAANELRRVLTTASFSPAERADAARALGRLGDAGREALLAGLLEMIAAPPALTSQNLLSAEFGVLKAAVDSLSPPLGKGAGTLGQLTSLSAEGEPSLLRRRVALRCRSAALLADATTDPSSVASCDPDPQGRLGRLASLDVLARKPLRAARLKRFQELAESDDLVVRQRALELLRTHPEVHAAPNLLAKALSSRVAGDVATAASILAEQPARGAAGQGEVAGTPGPATLEPGLARALAGALETWSSSPDIEVRSALLDAAGGVGLLLGKSRVERECASENPTLRAHAEKALRFLGDRGARCEGTGTGTGTGPAELERLVTSPAHLSLETESGTLSIELDPALAPVAVTRIVELARAGAYDGIRVHRVVPGFVVQLGDRDGDGYGGTDRPPLRCETSPSPFELGSVGIALSGRDTGGSQFFVSLGRNPHLDGEYAWIGRAGAGWDRLAEGDVVKKVHVR